MPKALHGNNRNVYLTDRRVGGEVSSLMMKGQKAWFYNQSFSSLASVPSAPKFGHEIKPKNKPYFKEHDEG